MIRSKRSICSMNIIFYRCLQWQTCWWLRLLKSKIIAEPHKSSFVLTFIPHPFCFNALTSCVCVDGCRSCLWYGAGSRSYHCWWRCRGTVCFWDWFRGCMQRLIHVWIRLARGRAWQRMRRMTCGERMGIHEWMRERHIRREGGECGITRVKWMRNWHCGMMRKGGNEDTGW